MVLSGGMVPGHIDSIHAALADYTCIIEDLIVTESRAAARMTFKGLCTAVDSLKCNQLAERSDGPALLFSPPMASRSSSFGCLGTLIV